MASEQQRTRGSGPGGPCRGGEGKGITLKKCTVMSCVRAPPWEKFLCKQRSPVREELLKSPRQAAPACPQLSGTLPALCLSPPAPSSRAPGPPTMVLTWGLQAPGEEGQRLCVTKRDLSSTSGHTCAFLKGVQRARFLITFPRLVRSEPLTLS